MNSPVKLARTPTAVVYGAGSPGGHTRTLLREQLGMDDATIGKLIEEDVVGKSE